MRNTVILTALILIAPFCSIKAQDKENGIRKNSIGIQYNPYIDSDFDRYKKNVSALKYGYSINNWLTFGSEISGFSIKSDVVKYNSYNLGLYGKVSYTDYRIKPFVELNGGLTYAHNYTKLLTDTTANTYSQKFATFGINSGFSFNLYKDIVTFDLYYKFSNENFVNMKKSVISYKICVKF